MNIFLDFKEQNDELIHENNKILDQVQTIIKNKEEHEQEMYEEFQKLRNENDKLKCNTLNNQNSNQNNQNNQEIEVMNI